TDVPVTSGNTTTNGIRYTWTVTDNSAITGESNSTGNGQNIGTIIAQTLTNTSSDAQMVTYSITPWTVNENGNNACAGTAINIDVWVEPTVTLAATGDTICNGGITDVPVTSGNTTTNGIRYTWTVTDNPAITGESNSTGNGQNIGTIIAQTLTNTSPDAQMVTYSITPWTVNENGNNACGGTAINIDVWVEPAVLVVATPESDTLCSGDLVNIDLNSGNNPTRPVLFRYQATIPFGVNVIPASGTALPNGSVLTDLLENTTDTAKLVLFIITPYTRMAGSELEKCSGNADTVRVWVEPVPKVDLTPGQDTICTSLRPAVHMTTVTRSLQPVRFIYEAIYNDIDVDVFYEQDTFDLAPGFILIDSIVNYSDVPQQVKFVVNPYLVGPWGERKCPGIADTTVIWVAPTLRVVIDTVSTYIGGRNIRCFGQSNGSIRLQPAGGISAFAGYDVYDLNYAWNNGRTTKDITSLNAGSYFISITDKFQCADDSLITLTQPDKLLSTVEVIDTLSCKGADGTIAPLTTGGTQGYLYNWTPPVDYYLDPPVFRDTLIYVIEGHYVLQISDTNGCLYATTFDLSQPQAVYVGAYPEYYGNYQIRCNGENSGSWTTVNNPPSLINYHWTGPNGFDSTFTSDQRYTYQDSLYAGRYTLRYTDASGCAGIFILDMIEPDPLLIDQSTVQEYNNRYNVSCFGSTDGSITLDNISGGHDYTGYTYDWALLSGTTFPDVAARDQDDLGAGIYAVTVRDTFNCAVSDTFELVQPDEIMINAEVSESVDGLYNLNCYGENSGYIIMHPTGGDTIDLGYQFQWQHGPDEGELHDLSAGTYFVTVTDGIGCTKMDTVIITQPPPLSVESVVFSDYNGFEVSCPGSPDGTLEILISGGSGNYVYSWSGDGIPLSRDTAYLDNLGPGLYSLLLTDGNNCGIDWSGSLDEPPALNLTIVTNNVNCMGTVPGNAQAQVAGGVAPYTYSWDNGQVTSFINNLDTGVYVLTVQDNNLCIITDTAVIEQNANVEIDIQVVEAISCHGGSDGILLALASSGTGPYMYEWNDGWTTGSINNIREGSYAVTVTDSEGCTGNLSLDVTDPEPLLGVFTANDALCYGSGDGTVELGATGGTTEYLFYWNDVLVKGNEVNYLTPGSYAFRVVDAADCQADTLVEIHQPEKMIIGFDRRYTVYPFCPDWQNGVIAVKVTGGTPDYQYIWTGYPMESDSVLNAVGQDHYTVRVIDAQNCVSDTTFRLTALNNTCLGIPTAFTPNYDFANDTWDISYITENGGEATFREVYPNGTILVYDRLGNLVFRCTGGCPEAWNGEDLIGRELPVDSYYFIIELNTGDQAPLKGTVTIIR
ncbi:MAG TPA: PKD-like domain-containing protein, partial [Bacteroidales bacterium]|nr:PKD-like domain-containing protein [Bacteroidales bacterium]